MKKLFLLLAGIAGIVLGASEIPQQKIQCGDTEITLVSRHYWNLNSIDYRGINLCRPRSFFGNVIRFKCGWVGTGHKENKIGEKDVKVKFFADGKEFVPAGQKITAEKFELKKSSILLDVKIDYEICFTADNLIERAKVTVLRDTDVAQFYLFMHPWCGIFTKAECINTDGALEVIDFTKLTKKQSLSRRNITRVNYYAPAEKITAVSTLRTITPAPGGKSAFLFWNRGVDRKLYFQPVPRMKLSAGTVFEYELTTAIEGK